MKQSTLLVIGMMLLNVGCAANNASPPLRLKQLDGTYRIAPPAFNGSAEMYVAIQGNSISWHELDTGATATETYAVTPLDNGNGFAYYLGDQLPLWIFKQDGHLVIDNGINESPTRLIPSNIPPSGTD